MPVEEYCTPDMCVTIDYEKRVVEVVTWTLAVIVRGFEEVKVGRPFG